VSEENVEVIKSGLDASARYAAQPYRLAQRPALATITMAGLVRPLEHRKRLHRAAHAALRSAATPWTVPS
jgi:hypothetical protein